MYTVSAHREARGWNLLCDEVPDLDVQVTRLTDAHSAARAALVEHDADVTDDDIVITPALSARATNYLETARDLQAQIRDLTDRAIDELAHGVKQLRTDGLTQRDIAAALGLSVDRVRALAAHEVEEEVPITMRTMEHLYASGVLHRRP